MKLDNERVADHLANERTYLAWLRTGLATMGFGVVIARLRGFAEAAGSGTPALTNAEASRIGITFVLIGLAIIVMAPIRYLSVRKRLRQNRFRAAFAIIAASSGIVIILGLLTLFYLLSASI